MHENDDLPQDSVDSIADGVENDDESNGQEELDPDQVRFFNLPCSCSLNRFIYVHFRRFCKSFWFVRILNWG